jgi:hypothetical protein
MANFSDCYEGLDSTGRMIPTPWFARILKREGYDPDCNRARAFDAAPQPDAGRWPSDLDEDDLPDDQCVALYDSAGEDGSAYAQAYERRANAIFDAARPTRHHPVVHDDLQDFDLRMRDWTEKYLKAQTPAELRAAIDRFRSECNDFLSHDDSIAFQLAHQRGAEAQRTKPRRILERLR